MINFRVSNNLPEVIDYVNKMYVDIQAIIAAAIESSKEDILSDLQSTFGIPSDDLEIDFFYNEGDYSLSVDGVNQYQLFNNTGHDMDYLLNYIENKIVDRIQMELDQAGYGHGN